MQDDSIQYALDERRLQTLLAQEPTALFDLLVSDCGAGRHLLDDAPCASLRYEILYRLTP